MGVRPAHRSLLARVIVGRDTVLSQLRALLDASATTGQVIALRGEAGLGKTRLVRALLAAAREQGRWVMQGRASSLEAALPLGVLLDALRVERRTFPDAPAPDDPLAAALPSLLLPELGAGEGTPDSDRGLLFEAAARYLWARSAPAGLVVVLEDLHWADPTSHALIGYLARATRDAPILLTLTYRPAEDPSHPSLDELRQELARERLGHELVLGPLGEEDVALMLRDILGVDAEPHVQSLVAHTSGGNPFVIEELVRDAVEGGRLDVDLGRWDLDEPLELPGTVQEMVLRRVRALSAGERELLRWAAVLGERFDPALLAILGDLTERATLATLERLRDAGLVADLRDGGDGRLAFRHALTREAVLGELLGPERKRRHARVLEVVEELPEAARLPLDEILEHALGAADHPKSFRYSIEAAGRAADLGGYQEAQAHYERALTLWRPTDGLETRAGLFMRLGYLTSLGGGLIACAIDPRSQGHFEKARDLYEEVGDRTSAAVARAGVVWSGRAFDLLDDLRQARAMLGPDAPPDARCQILGRLAEREFLVGYPRAALRTSAEGLALLEAHPGVLDPVHFPRPGQLRRSFQLIAASATWWLGDRTKGRTGMLALAEDALARNDTFWAMLAYQALSRASLDRPSDALRFVERAIELDNGEVPTMALWLTHLHAQAHVHLAEWAAAGALLDRADARLAQVPEQPYLRHALGMIRGELCLGRGDLRRAVDLLGLLAPEVDELQGRIFKRVVRVTLARALLAEDDLPRAQASLAPLISRWERAEEGPFVLSALLPMAAVEVAATRGDWDAAVRWSGELAALNAGPRAAYVRALANLARGVPDGERGIEDAACAVETDGRRWEGAWMRMVGAGAALRASDSVQAADLASVALERFRSMAAEGWCRRVEAFLRGLGRQVPSHRSGRAAGGLTVRELEVLRLVADGASNQEIARCLFISKPTAVRHVANIFRKLEVKNRAEAVRVASDRGLLEARD